MLNTSLAAWQIGETTFPEYVVLTRVLNDFLIHWTETDSEYDVRFSVYCFAAVLASSASLVRSGSSTVGVSLPSFWLFVDPVADDL